MQASPGNFMVAAWGADSFAIERAKAVDAMATSRNITFKCWGRTKEGHPGHLLYLRRDAAPAGWTP